MRTINIKLAAVRGLIKVETNATTLGELKKEISENYSDQNIPTTNVKFVDIKTKNSLEDDRALLPAGDAYFLPVPITSKSGVEILSEEEVDEMGYNEARSYGSALNKENGAAIALSGRRDDIVPRIKEFLASQNSADGQQAVGLLKDAVELINAAISKVKEIKSGTEVEYAIPGMTLEELEKECDLLMKKLG